MADEMTAPAADATTVAEPGAAPQQQQPVVVAPAPAGLISYVVKHRLLHDGKEYAPGAIFQHPDPAVTAALRKARAIVLATEMQAADEVAARMAALEAQLLATQQENARLQALRDQAAATAASVAAQPASKSGK